MFSFIRLRGLAAVCPLLITVVLVIPASAQVAGGTISGTVKDPSGAVVPRAAITITNEATGVARNVDANTDGLYTAPNLLPGTYDLKCTAPGFRTEVRRGVLLTVGATQVLDVTMQVGTTRETVVVTSEVPAVQLGTSDISAVVSATTVRELPRVQDPNSALVRSRHGSRQSRLWTATDHFWGPPATKQLPFGRHQFERLRQWSARQRPGRKPGRGRHSRVLGPDQQLLGRVRQDFRRGGQRYYAFWDKSDSRERLRIPPE